MTFVRLILLGSAILVALASVAMFCLTPAFMLLSRAELLSATLPPARLATLASLSLAALPIGALCASGLARASRPLRLTVSALLVAALVGAGWSRMQVQPPSEQGALLLASIAIVMLVLTPRLADLDPVLLDSVAASGASPWSRLRIVILPWIAGPCLAAFLLCLAVDAAFWLSAG